jgi:PAS domain S-box-containing protein
MANLLHDEGSYSTYNELNYKETRLNTLSKRIRRETILLTITQDVHRSINIEEVFENAVDTIKKNVIGAENVSIHMIDGEKAILKAYAGYPECFIDRIKIIPYPKDYTWRTIMDEKSIYCANVDRDIVVGRVGREIGVKSYLSMPIHFIESVVGVINISSTKKNIFDNEDLALLELVSQQIEITINNARKTEELKKSEKRFRILFENTPIGLYRFTRGGKILDANPAFISMLGFSSIEELAVHGFENQNFRSDLSWGKTKETIELHGEIKGIESVWNKRDNTKIYVMENIMVVRTNDGNVLFYEGTVEDITERKVVQNKLEEDILYLEKKINRRTTQLVNANDSLRKEISEKKQKGNELKNSNKQLRALTNHLESVREEERTKISREVHDGLGQSMICLKIDLELLSKQINEMSDKPQIDMINKAMKKMSALIDFNIQSVRRIAMELRPGVLDDLGTVAAIEWQAQDFEKLAGIKCIFNSEVEDLPLDRKSSTALFRIFQEILTNIARHAEATMVKVNIKERRNKYILQVDDNGIGIPMKEISAPQSLGLLGIKERAILIGGYAKIVGKHKKGTKVLVTVPRGRHVNDQGSNC